MGIQLRKVRQLCGAWVLRTAQGGGDASRIFSAGRVCKRVRLPKFVHKKAGGTVFIFPKIAIRDVSLVYKLVPREQSLCAEAARDFRSQISNTGEEDIDLGNRDKGITRCTSRKELLLDFMEDDGDRDWTGRRQSV